MIKAVVLLAILACAFAQKEQFKCPHEYGFYPHSLSCDKYWKCENNEADLKTCGNGLAFDSSDPKFLTENCDYLHNVDCGARSELEPPITSANCPRLYGIFPDEERCDVFWSCWNGDSNKYSCAPGLAYDREARVCMWADQVPECKVTETQGGFKCPLASANPNPGTFSRHAHPEDCRKYYVCLDNSPREYGCPIGTVFKIGADEYSGQCTDPEGVDGCENYYGDDLKGLKKSELLLGLTGDSGSSSYAVTNKPTIRKKIQRPAAEPVQQPQPAPSQQSNTRVQQNQSRDRVRPSQAARPSPVTTPRPAPTTEATKATDANKSDDYYYYDNYEDQPANGQQQQQRQ